MEKSSEYTLLKTTGRFFSLVYKSLEVWPAVLIYGALLTAVYCGLLIATTFCAKENQTCQMVWQGTMGVFLSIVSLCYLVDFYRIVFKNSVFKISNLIQFDKAKIKSVIFIVGYIFSFVISAYVSKNIVFKPANPDWRIEFVYFCVFFAFCMLPVLAMRFSSLVAFYLNEQKIPSLKYMYEQTMGRSYIGVVGFLLVILMSAVFNMQTYSLEVRLFSKFQSSLALQVIITFIDAMVKLFILGWIVCFFEAQRQLMTANEEEVAEEITVLKSEENAETKTVKKGKSKSGKKKKSNNI